ncbi:type VI secretion system-associated FHA domain protein TagH [Mesorhizobium sp. A556]
MSLLLTLEQGPRSQAVRQTGLDKGELVIGRSPEADWQIDDPDMYVSRAHCKITSEQDGYTVTDMSSSGLFIDDSGSPLGAGNSIRLRNGMRLRLGDYVVGVELQAPAAAQSALWQSASPLPAPRAPSAQPPVPTPNSASIGHDDFFSSKAEEEPRLPRPADLPDPFDHPKPGAFQAFERAGSNERGSAAFDDPFSLDPVSDPSSNEKPGRVGASGFDDPFHVDAGAPPPPPAGAKEAAQLPPIAFDDGFNLGPGQKSAARAGVEIAAPHARVAETGPPPAPWDLRPGLPQNPPVPVAVQQAPQPSAGNGGHTSGDHASPQGSSDAALRSAFLRGVGLEDIDLPDGDPLAEMERFGREYRMMLEGLMQLLRKRSEEKGNARVAQTVVGASQVNPLKFLPTVDDALATIAAGRSPGFLDGEAAIMDAIRDLAQHHVRAWRGVQGALRRMIDRFDPSAIEAELKSGSAIETLLAGGRGAKLWELYQKRHREIATSAESRFLGEIGADFRDAYEEE